MFSDDTAPLIKAPKGLNCCFYFPILRVTYCRFHVCELVWLISSPLWRIGSLLNVLMFKYVWLGALHLYTTKLTLTFGWKCVLKMQEVLCSVKYSWFKAIDAHFHKGLYLSLCYFSLIRSFCSQHGDGQIDIRLYVIALSTVHRPSKSMETLKLAFKVSTFTSKSGLI